MSHRQQSLDDWLKPFTIDDDKLCRLTRQLSSTYAHLALSSSEQFLATPVTRLPSGQERGEFLAIDLGGTNLRVAFVSLLGQLSDEQKGYQNGGSGSPLPSTDDQTPENVILRNFEKSWPIGAQLKADNAEDLFEWLGDCLAEVIRDRLRDGDYTFTDIPLGITFSFPMITTILLICQDPILAAMPTNSSMISDVLYPPRQSTLAKATLLPMGKGFTITSNPDLGAMVLAGYAKHTKTLPRIKIVAIANDAVSTLISLCHVTEPKSQSRAVIGLILGTGCNAAVTMKTTAVGSAKLATVMEAEKSGEMVINTEWTMKGAVGPLSELGLITPWDTALDRAVGTPGFQPFEYMTSGHYLGEIVRLVVLDWMTSELKLDANCLPSALVQPYALTTTFLTRNVEKAKDSSELADTLNASSPLYTAKDWTWTPEAANIVLRAERVVLLRSSAMIAAAIVALLISAGELSLAPLNIAIDIAKKDPVLLKPMKQLIVGYCGGLICLYGGYKERIQAFVDRLVSTLVVERDVRVVLREASEGGVIGAGVLAATNWPPPP